MAEPPILVEPDGPRAELRRTGHRNLDLIIAVTAIGLSLISLFVAIGNARTQEKMVAAATWPLLQYDTGNVEGERAEISMTVENTGVGPALLRTVRLTYEGRPVRGWPELLAACCGLTRELNSRMQAEGVSSSVLSAGLRNKIIRPGDELTFIRMRRSELNAEVWDALDKARFAVRFEGCYCSVFEECWRSDLESITPRRVRECRPTPADYDE